MQQPLAEGVDGLDFQAAGRLDRAREQPPRESEPRRDRAPRRPPRRSRRQGPRRTSRVHCASVLNTRSAILAAAALVKVRQRMREGGAPPSSRRSTRCASTCVLPEPALAETQAEARGVGSARLRDARCQRNLAAAPCALMARLLRSRQAAGRRPFLDAREMIVVAETAGEFRIGARQIGRLRLRELLEQSDEFGEMLVDDIGETDILEAEFARLAALGAAELQIERADRLDAAAPRRKRRAPASPPPA